MSTEQSDTTTEEAQALRDAADFIASRVLELVNKLDYIQSQLDELHRAKPDLLTLRGQADAVRVRMEDLLLARRYKQMPQYGIWIERPAEPPAPVEKAPAEAEAAPAASDEPVIIVHE
jgi:CRP-like cAMP-binding protein